MGSKSMVFYESWFDNIQEEKLNPGTELFIYRTILNYGLKGIVTDPNEIKDPVARTLYRQVIPLIDKSKEHRENGKKGGRGNKKSEKQGGFKGGFKPPLSDVDVDVDVDTDTSTASAYPQKSDSGCEKLEDDNATVTQEDIDRWKLENGWKLIDGKWVSPNEQGVE